MEYEHMFERVTETETEAEAAERYEQTRKLQFLLQLMSLLGPCDDPDCENCHPKDRHEGDAN